MKKLLVFCALAGMMGSLWAAIQFDSIRANTGVGLKVTQGGNLYLSTSSAALPAGASAFGYYTMDKNGKVTGGGTIDLAKLSKNGGLVGDFAAGTQIGFWVKNEQGAYYDSMYRNEDKGNDRNAAYVGNNGEHEDKINMIIGAGGYGNGYSPYKGEGGAKDLIFTASGSSFGKDEPPVGQPLPGIMITLVLGFGIYMIVNQLRHRQQA